MNDRIDERASACRHCAAASRMAGSRLSVSPSRADRCRRRASAASRAPAVEGPGEQPPHVSGSEVSTEAECEQQQRPATDTGASD